MHYYDFTSSEEKLEHLLLSIWSLDNAQEFYDSQIEDIINEFGQELVTKVESRFYLSTVFRLMQD